MRKRDIIKQKFEEFVTALENFQPEKIGELVTEDVRGHFSNVGESEGKDELIKSLMWKGREMNVSRRRITNFVVRTEGDRAQQSAYVMSLIGYDNGSFLFPFEFGGKYVVSWRDQDGEWKIKEIRYDMDWEKGNTYFAEGWSFIDIKFMQAISR